MDDAVRLRMRVPVRHRSRHQGSRCQWPGTRRAVGRGATRSAAALRQAVMLAEIAVATVLLSGAGLMVHTMVRLARVDPGFDPHNLQTVTVCVDGPVARRQEAGVLRRRGRTSSCAAGSGERRHHLFAADSGLELVDRVQYSGQDCGALDIGWRVSECGYGSRDRQLFRHTQDSAGQRPVFRPDGHTRLGPRCHRQQQRRQEVLAQ